MQDPDYQELREALQLDETSNVLMFSTEGDTDPDNYKKIFMEVKGMDFNAVNASSRRLQRRYGQIFKRPCQKFQEKVQKKATKLREQKAEMEKN